MAKTQRAASEGVMEIRERLAEEVGTSLKRNERETGLSFFGDADCYQITSYSPTIVRSLLRHEYAEIAWVYLGAPLDSNRRVEDIQRLANSEGLPQIEGVRAILPVSTFKVKGTPRNSNHQSGIVSTPDEAANIQGLIES